MRIHIAFLLVCSFTAGFAQTSGRIHFEEKMDLHKSLPPDREEFKDMIPQFNTSDFELFFDGQVSVYQARKEAEDPEVNTQSGNMRMSMRWGRDNRVVFKNLEENRTVDSRDFLQKQFLIKGPLTDRKWKITAQQKEILGYMCLSASLQMDSATALVAWFAPQLAIPNGPADYQGLPGMILQIDINDGHRQITAKEITFEPVDPALLKEPSKGKEVTTEEFEKIREEKMKEMEGHGPGGSRQMMIFRH